MQKYLDLTDLKMTYHDRQTSTRRARWLDFPNDTTIAFSSDKKPEPVAYGFSMGLEAPMWNWDEKSMPKLAGPCVLEDGKTIHLNEADFIDMNFPDRKIEGRLSMSLRRVGLSVRYEIKVQYDDPNVDDSNYFGVWKFNSNLKNFPPNFDVQAWSVFRERKLLISIRKGKPFPVSKLKKKYGINAPK